MADVVNLRQARKAKARSEKEQKAAENRVMFGRTKGERKLDQAEKSRASRALTQKKMTSEGPEE